MSRRSRRLAAHAWNEPRAGRSRRLARDENNAGRRRSPRLPRPRRFRRARRRASRAPSRTSGTIRSRGWWTRARPTASSRSMARSAILRRRRPAKRSSQRLPHGLRRRLDLAPPSDRNRQGGVFPRPGRGRLRAKDSRRDARRIGRGHDRRQNAGRRDVEASARDRRPRPTDRSRKKDSTFASRYNM